MVRPTKFDEPLARPRSFRLRKSDDEKFKKKLTESGLETSAFLREYILQNKTEVIARPQKSITRESCIELIRLIGQVQKVGNNINQIAHRANSDFLAGTLTESVYRDLVTQLEDVSLHLKTCLPKWD